MGTAISPDMRLEFQYSISWYYRMDSDGSLYVWGYPMDGLPRVRGGLRVGDDQPGHHVKPDVDHASPIGLTPKRSNEVVIPFVVTRNGDVINSRTFTIRLRKRLPEPRSFWEPWPR